MDRGQLGETIKEHKEGGKGSSNNLGGRGELCPVPFCLPLIQRPKCACWHQVGLCFGVGDLDLNPTFVFSQSECVGEEQVWRAKVLLC